MNTSLPERGVIELEGVDPEAVADGLRAEGRRVFVLAGRITDKHSFFEAVRSTLPLDPPDDGPNDNWDALNDSLWEGLHQLPDVRVAVIWAGWRVMADVSPKDFRSARDTFVRTSESVADPRQTARQPVDLLVLLLEGGRRDRWLRFASHLPRLGRR